MSENRSKEEEKFEQFLIDADIDADNLESFGRHCWNCPRQSQVGMPKYECDFTDCLKQFVHFCLT